MIPTLAYPGIRRQRRRWQPKSIVLLGAAIVVAAMAIFPLYWMFLTSVTPMGALLTKQPTLFPQLELLSIDAYVSAFTDKDVLRWFGNSVMVTVGSSALAMVVSLMAGYSLSRLPSRGQGATGYALLLTRIIPGTVLVLPLFIMFNSIGLTDGLLALVLANATIIVPFAAWLMKGFFDGIPYELEEAAMIDGCSRFQAVCKIVLPLTAPGLAATALYATMTAWGDFLFARTLIDSTDLWTLTVGLSTFMNENGTDWSGLMAVGLLSVLPLVVLFFVLQPFFVGGLASGGVKG
ncbi:carbohydrate ABC transporter permease [Cryobacterium sp. Y11]|uniref:carbohydrate ABC transporter permease n=1 Tax=Cryobacterium sp. Y11 TaxID=2045016 RepID=UPI0011B082E1|nr:carbohydrate ABC transporter permease [Cryobacterium sp. Y11]